MNPIKKINGTISAVYDLTPTAREITIALNEPLTFLAGCFVNVFIEHEGVTLRRAFSISSDDAVDGTIKISVRLNHKGMVTPLFWAENIIGKEVVVMGPLGLNTADKMQAKRIFLFGYGIGAGVVKALAEHYVKLDDISEIRIMTGNRSEDEIIHKDFFDKISMLYNNIHVTYVVTDVNPGSVYPKGFIQDHIQHLDFNNSDVYVCGQEVACTALVTTVKNQNPQNCNFFVEAFH